MDYLESEEIDFVEQAESLADDVYIYCLKRKIFYQVWERFARI
jgi:hypothetical protein